MVGEFVAHEFEPSLQGLNHSPGPGLNGLCRRAFFGCYPRKRTRYAHFEFILTHSGHQADRNRALQRELPVARVSETNAKLSSIRNTSHR
jgi:hypothetical protein